jgi:hypothetical protein
MLPILFSTSKTTFLIILIGLNPQTTRRRAAAAAAKAETKPAPARAKKIVEKDSEPEETRPAARRKRAEPAKATAARRKAAAVADVSESEVSSSQVSVSVDVSPPKRRTQAAKRKRAAAPVDTDDDDAPGYSPKPKNVFQAKGRRTKRSAAAAAIPGSSASSSNLAPVGSIIKGDDADDSVSYYSMDEERSVAASDVDDKSILEDDSEIEERKPKIKRRKTKDEEEMEVDQEVKPKELPPKATKKPVIIGAAAKRRIELQKRSQAMKLKESEVLKEFESPTGKLPVFKDEPLPTVLEPESLPPPPVFEPYVPEPHSAPVLESDNSSFLPPLTSSSSYRLTMEPLNSGAVAGSSPPPIAASYVRVDPASVNKIYRPPATAGYNLNAIPNVGGGGHHSPQTPYVPPIFTTALSRAARPPAPRVPEVKPPPVEDIKTAIIAPSRPVTGPPLPIIPPEPLKPIYVPRKQSKGPSTAFWGACVAICLVVGILLIWLSAWFTSVPNEAGDLEVLNKAIKDNSLKLYNFILSELKYQRGAYECQESDAVGFNLSHIRAEAEQMFPPDQNFYLEYREDFISDFLKRVKHRDSEILLDSDDIFLVHPDLAIKSLSCVVRSASLLRL